MNVYNRVFDWHAISSHTSHSHVLVSSLSFGKPSQNTIHEIYYQSSYQIHHDIEVGDLPKKEDDINQVNIVVNIKYFSAFLVSK